MSARRSVGPLVGCFTVLAAACTRPGSETGAIPATVSAAVAELLAADRAFSAASERSDPAPGLLPMFTHDAVTAAPGGRFAAGRGPVVAVLTTGPDFSGGHLRWTPVRGGISADGQQGFTLGYLAVRRTDGTDAPFRYLAYWMKSRAGWKVVAYRRVRAAAGDVSVEPMPPSVPERMARPSSDSVTIRAFRASLDSTERAFSDEAQTTGLGPAFMRYGRPDAVHVGGSPNRCRFSA